jgi:hypothetical protein
MQKVDLHYPIYDVAKFEKEYFSVQYDSMYCTWEINLFYSSST